MSAPKTPSQPSRKTKKAWRKNIDLTAITKGIDSARDETLITGHGLLADAPATSLFQTDTAGDVGVQRAARREYGNLKVDEILAQRSAVPAVSAKKRSAEDRTTDGVIAKRAKKGGGVSKSEYERLRQVAFGGVGESQLASQVRNGDVQLLDPWEDVKVVHPAELSYVDPAQPIREPRTLRQAPIPLTASGKAPSHVRMPAAGKSYNPTFEDWSALLSKAGDAELDLEKKRLAAAEKEAMRLDAIAKAGEEPENAPEDGAISEYESEWEGIQSELDEEVLAKKRPQRKTPAERNKIKRRQQREALERHQAHARRRDEQTKRIVQLRREVEAKEKARSEALAIIAAFDGEVASDPSEDEAEGEQLRKRRFGQRSIPERALELVLPDELEDSLRRLKPEGNLLTERFRNAIVQGRVEARPKPIGQQKKRKETVTTKWSYKDWTLEGGK